MNGTVQVVPPAPAARGTADRAHLHDHRKVCQTFLGAPTAMTPPRRPWRRRPSPAPARRSRGRCWIRDRHDVVGVQLALSLVLTAPATCAARRASGPQVLGATRSAAFHGLVRWRDVLVVGLGPRRRLGNLVRRRSSLARLRARGALSRLRRSPERVQRRRTRRLRSGGGGTAGITKIGATYSCRHRCACAQRLRARGSTSRHTPARSPSPPEASTCRRVVIELPGGAPSTRTATWAALVDRSTPSSEPVPYERPELPACRALPCSGRVPATTAPGLGRRR